ncbi:MAG: radical SAM family heme chaperone HemW, partial [Lachnospiraceae bacterium]|nr:radical SAM family heme chaperone HemW [Candidatus Equihabitans merdae]
MKNNMADSRSWKAGGLGLYIHIPFCIRKCRYCDFLSFPSDQATREANVRQLLVEIQEWGDRLNHCRVDTVFFGGGTPTVLETRQLCAILVAVNKAFSVDKDAEVSMEMNPGTDREDLGDLIKAGINRVSIGLQSTEDALLAKLGRIHNFEAFRSTYTHLRDLGLTNINIDLMNALPGQTLSDWETTLKKVVDMKPEHISAYSLIIEPGTPFAKMEEDGLLDLPDEETERMMYQRVAEILRDGGYHRYEISNYARDGYECRHNKRYWTGKPYLGLGLGASSYMDQMRWKNTSDMETYLSISRVNYSCDSCMMTEFGDMDIPDGDKNCSDSQNSQNEHHRIAYQMDSGMDPQSTLRDYLQKKAEKNQVEELEVSSSQDQMEEFMITGLRLMEGVSSEVFQERFASSMEEVFGDVIKGHIRDGLLRRTAEGIALTDKGIDISN